MRRPATTNAQTFAALILQGDYWRRSPASAGGPAGHKEWSHFCVLGKEVNLLLNFSMTDFSHGEGLRVEVPRVTAIARLNDGTWEGDVETYTPDDVELAASGIDFCVGANR